MVRTLPILILAAVTFGAAYPIAAPSEYVSALSLFWGTFAMLIHLYVPFQAVSWGMEKGARVSYQHDREVPRPVSNAATQFMNFMFHLNAPFFRRGDIYGREAETLMELLDRELEHLSARASSPSKRNNNAAAFDTMLNQYNQLQSQQMLENMEMQKAQAF
jgi:hypothetical protein